MNEPGLKFGYQFRWATLSALLSLLSVTAIAQSPSPALLVLEKSANSVAIVDPGTFKIVGRVAAGADPHEIVVSSNGQIAYISNYGGLGSDLNTISVVDIAARKALAPISLGALHSPHGLCYAGNKLYFTAETNKVVGRYDPATHAIDWVVGTGQERTHMVVADETQNRIFASNVNSGTITIIEQVVLPAPGPPPGAQSATPPPQTQSAQRKDSQITNVPSGRGSEGFDVGINGTEVWAANAQDNTVTVIDVATKKPRLTFPISVERANRLKFTPDGKRVLVSGLGAGPQGSPDVPNLVVIDAATHKEIKQFNLGGGSAGILILADGSRAYVAVSAKDKVVAIDLQKLEVAGELSTGKNPDGLAWAAPK
jgi:DNA-binding beta-propeller fold protein YncE